jgi:NADPH:quinone reductase-like Zn-dependent oxidoreductase
MAQAAHAEQVLADALHMLPIPDGTSDQAAAALTRAGLHQAQLGPVSAGRVVRPPYSPKNWAAACWTASDQVG